jgi:peptide/nickel transport system permease protein
MSTERAAIPFARTTDVDGRSPFPRTAVIALSLIVAAAVFAPLLAPYDPALQLDIVTLKNQPPSGSHPFGTDPFARDTFSRLLFGARTSLIVAAIATATATIVGGFWGVVSGWSSRRLSAPLVALSDIYRSLPRILVLLAIFVVAGAMTPSLIAIAAGVALWPVVAAIVHAEVVRVRSSQWMEGAIAIGTPTPKILLRHVLPHLAGPVSATTVLLFADVLALEAGLSFIGLGVRAPLATWGGMIQDALPYLQSAWWVALFPATALVATVLSISALANWADEIRARN